jgi:hypothetical protein
MDARPGEQFSGSPKEGQGQLKVTVRASNGAQIRVWRENNLYYARPAGSAVEPQICAAVDLFEVIAELAGLNLEVTAHSAEAVALSVEAQRELEDTQDRLEDASGSE